MPTFTRRRAAAEKFADRSTTTKRNTRRLRLPRKTEHKPRRARRQPGACPRQARGERSSEGAPPPLSLQLQTRIGRNEHRVFGSRREKGYDPFLASRSRLAGF